MTTLQKQNKEIEQLEDQAIFLGDMLFNAKHKRVQELIRKRLVNVQQKIFSLYQVTPLNK